MRAIDFLRSGCVLRSNEDDSLDGSGTTDHDEAEEAVGLSKVPWEVLDASLRLSRDRIDLKIKKKTTHSQCNLETIFSRHLWTKHNVHSRVLVVKMYHLISLVVP